MNKILKVFFNLVISITLLTCLTYAKTEVNIFEEVNPDGTITRTYKKPLAEFDKKSVETSHENIKKILRNLGMEDCFIDNLTDKDLEFYENSGSIVGKISYIKTDKNGVKKTISELEANKDIFRIKKLNSLQRTLSHEQDTYEDEYMRVFHMVSQYGSSSSFRYSTDARWLTMPFFRRTDSIGSCAQGISIEPRTLRGYYQYSVDYIYPFGRTEHGFKHFNIDERDIYRDSYASFNGAAAKLTLPVDIYNNNTGGTSLVYSDYKVHFQYDARMQYPDQESYFDSIGTYDHLRIGIDFNPSLSIGAEGGSFSIGLGVSAGTDKRSVPLQIHYQPW